MPDTAAALGSAGLRPEGSPGICLYLWNIIIPNNAHHCAQPCLGINHLPLTAVHTQSASATDDLMQAGRHSLAAAAWKLPACLAKGSACLAACPCCAMVPGGHTITTNLVREGCPAGCSHDDATLLPGTRGLCVGAAAARKLLPGCRHAAHMPPAPLACLHHGCSALVCSRRSTGVPGWDPARQQLHHAAVAQLEASRGACESCAVLPQVCNHPLHMTSHPTCHIDTCSRPQQCIPTCLAVPWATGQHPPASGRAACQTTSWAQPAAAPWHIHCRHANAHVGPHLGWCKAAGGSAQPSPTSPGPPPPRGLSTWVSQGGALAAQLGRNVSACPHSGGCHRAHERCCTTCMSLLTCLALSLLTCRSLLPATTKVR